MNTLAIVRTKTSKVVRQILIDVFKHGYISGSIYNMSNLIIVYGGKVPFHINFDDHVFIRIATMIK